jgi:hypothetical protein
LEASRRSETSSSEDEAKEEDSEEGIDDSNVEGWFGIKRGQGNREQKRLFVADRRISKTEKVFFYLYYNCHVNEWKTDY